MTANDNDDAGIGPCCTDTCSFALSWCFFCFLKAGSNEMIDNDNYDAGIGCYCFLLCQHSLLLPFLVFLFLDDRQAQYEIWLNESKGKNQKEKVNNPVVKASQDLTSLGI